MRTYLQPIGLISLLLGSSVVGCQGTPKDTYPADPLFAIKKPQQTKADNAEPLLVADAAPQEPAVPAAVLAARQGSRDPATQPAFLPEPGQYRVGYPPGSTSP